MYGCMYALIAKINIVALLGSSIMSSTEVAKVIRLVLLYKIWADTYCSSYKLRRGFGRERLLFEIKVIPSGH